MVGLAGCTTDRLAEPTETATEQLLVSTAVDAAVARLEPKIPRGTRLFLDAQYVDSTPADAALYTKYAVASVRDRLLQLGVRLVDDRRKADMVAELRTGGQSIDHHGLLVGIPSIPVPVPLTGTVTTPKLALFESDRQIGVAKLALTAYDADGKLTASTGPTYGLSHDSHRTALLFISWSDQDILPDQAKK